MKYFIFFALIASSVVTACLPRCRSCICSGGCPGTAICHGSGDYCHCDDDKMTQDDIIQQKLVTDMCKSLTQMGRNFVIPVYADGESIQVGVSLNCTNGVPFATVSV